MTRPRKQTVDWFPHKCNHGATLFSFEGRYGNDGYAFWFKLLEVLGATEGHRIDCKEEKRMAYLCAYTKTEAVVCAEMLSFLARMDAIDPDLWTGARVIWCQNFVDGIHAAYRNRQLPPPDKPDCQHELPGLIGVSDAVNPRGTGAGEGGDGGEAAPDTPPVPPPAGTLPGEKRRVRPPPCPTPPAVARYREMAHRFPNKSLYGDIAAVIGEGPEDLDRWGALVKSWIARGFNPSNIQGMLEAYKSRVDFAQKRASPLAEIERRVEETKRKDVERLRKAGIEPVGKVLDGVVKSIPKPS